MPAATPTQLDQLLIRARNVQAAATEISDGAFALAQMSEYTGQRRQLERIGRAALDLAVEIGRTKF